MNTKNPNSPAAQAEKDTSELYQICQEMLSAEEEGTAEKLENYLSESFTIIRGSGFRQDRKDFLHAVPDNANKGRVALEAPEILFGADFAVVCGRISTRPTSESFWNTRVFAREKGGWRCISWQVTKINEAKPGPGLLPRTHE